MIVMQFLGAFFAAVFVENLLFTRAMDVYGMKRLFESPRNILRLGSLVTAILAVAGPLTYLLHRLIRPLPFLYYISVFVQLLLLTLLYLLAYCILRKYVPGLFEEIGRQLPFAAFNCATLGTMLLATKNAELDRWWKCTAYHIGAGVGFTLALLLMWSIRQRQMYCEAPKSFRGYPLKLVTAGLIALALAGLMGNQLPA